MKYTILTVMLMAIVVVLMIVIMSSLRVPEFEQGIIAGLVPGLALWVVDRIEKGKAESINIDSVTFTRQRTSMLFVALIVTSIAYWTLTLAWYTGFQDMLDWSIVNSGLKGIEPYVYQALQKTVAGGLFLSSWLPLTIATCLLLGVFLGQLRLVLILLANALALGIFVLVTQVAGWTKGGFPIESLLKTMFQGSIDQAPLIQWDRIVLSILTFGGFLVILLALSLVVSLSLSIGAWLGRHGRRISVNETPSAINQAVTAHRPPEYLAIEPSTTSKTDKKTANVPPDTVPNDLPS